MADAGSKGVVGAGHAPASLQVTGASDIQTTAITTVGAQNYDGAVTLSRATVGLTGSTITLGSTVNTDGTAAGALTVTGDAVFKGVVGASDAPASDRKSGGWGKRADVGGQG